MVNSLAIENSLKKCPFCGCKPHFTAKGFARIDCRVCDFEMYASDVDRAYDLADRWNRRATDDYIDDLIDNLRALKSGAS